MPHSSGGGSSGGGFHGGSSGSGSGPRYSSRPFPGSTCYVYYDSAFAPHLLYSTSDPSKAKPAGIGSFILFGLLAIAPWAIFIGLGFHNPTKLATNYNTNIVIRDTHNILTESEENSIQNKYEEFFNASGITPGLLCVDDVDWQNFTTLEDYAYRQYISLYDDEKHWLIVYSTFGTGNTRWAFEGMQGNDTDPILTSRVTETFTQTFHDNLKSQKTVTESLIGAFDVILPNLMEPSFYIEIPKIIFGCVWSGAMVFITVSSVISNRKKKEYKSAVKAPTDLSMHTCPSCHCSYYAGTVDRCPRCGSEVDYPRYASFPEEER